jgi:hypothetical protein
MTERRQKWAENMKIISYDGSIKIRTEIHPTAEGDADRPKKRTNAAAVEPSRSRMHLHYKNTEGTATFPALQA